MSRSIAKFLYKLDSSLIAFLSARQKSRVFSRINERIKKDSIHNVSTNKGEIKFYRLESAYVASSIERFHEDEPETLEWISNFSDGDVFWDVGANIGLFTMYAALGGNIKVYAFEPNALNYKILIEHLNINHLDDKVTALCLAFSDRQLISNIFSNEQSPGLGSSLSEAKSQFGDYVPAYQQSIISYEIDRFIDLFKLQQPTHIKIDVDGIEPLIIKSALKTLSNVKSLMVEVEGNNIDKFDNTIAKELNRIGLIENENIRNMGHKRNRLYFRE